MWEIVEQTSVCYFSPPQRTLSQKISFPEVKITWLWGFLGAFLGLLVVLGFLIARAGCCSLDDVEESWAAKQSLSGV